MKRFVISLIIILLIIFSSFSVPVYLKKTTTELTNVINEINTDIENNDFNLALIKTNKLSALWEDKKNIINIFVNNNELDHVTFATAQLFPLLKYKNKTEFCSKLSYIKSVIISIYDNDVPSFNNII